MSDYRPIIGITMGDPVGIGPEIILISLCKPSIYNICRPLVIGDFQILDGVKKCVQSQLHIKSVKDPDKGLYKLDPSIFLIFQKSFRTTYYGAILQLKRGRQ